MKKNTAKKALILSILALVLSMAMLIGTTYAWFTDTAASAGNVVKSGVLDVELSWAEDPTGTWTDASASPIFNYELWEPGYTQIRYVRIANVGNLAFRYEMSILPVGTVGTTSEGKTLADVIDVYYFDAASKEALPTFADRSEFPGTELKKVDGTLETLIGSADVKGVLLPEGETKTGFYTGEVYVVLALHMQEEAGNEYQNLSIGDGFTIRLLATQYTYEEDSFDDQYDRDSAFVNPEPVSNAQDLAAALTDATETTVSVKLTEDIDLPISSLGTITGGSGQYKLGNENTKSITVDLDGHKLNVTTTYWSILGAKNPNAVITFKNGTLTSSQTSGTWNSYDFGFNDCRFVLENVVFEKAVACETDVSMKNVTINESHDYYALWITTDGQTVDLDNVTINCPNGRAIKVDDQYRTDTAKETTLNVKDSAFTSAKKSAILVKSHATTNVNVSNLDISNVAADSTNAVWRDNSSGYESFTINVTGATLINEP